MSRRRNRNRRRNAGDADELPVWELANKLRECKNTKNAMPNLPGEKMTKESAADYLGQMCLLEQKSPVGKHKFSKRFFVSFVSVLWVFFVFLVSVIVFQFGRAIMRASSDNNARLK